MYLFIVNKCSVGGVEWVVGGVCKVIFMSNPNSVEVEDGLGYSLVVVLAITTNDREIPNIVSQG